MTDSELTPSENLRLEAHPASWPEERLLAQCRISFSRASGPGGQNRNKVETSVQIEFLPNRIIASASERRTQNENRKVAIQRLRCKLAVEVRTPSRASALGSSISPIIASSVWRTYCRGGKIDVADTNVEWPGLLAELIDALHTCQWNVSVTATGLETSSSQLVKLLKKFPPAFSLLNEERSLRGQRALS